MVKQHWANSDGNPLCGAEGDVENVTRLRQYHEEQGLFCDVCARLLDTQSTIVSIPNALDVFDMFRRISILADERLRGGSLSKEQEEILHICAMAGVGLTTCVGPTGPTGPPGEEG